LKRASPRELILKHFCLHPESISGTLYDGPIGHSTASHEEGDADQSFVTRYTHFGGRAVLHHVQQRNDDGSRKIDITEECAQFQVAFSQQFRRFARSA